MKRSPPAHENTVSRALASGGATDSALRKKLFAYVVAITRNHEAPVGFKHSHEALAAFARATARAHGSDNTAAQLQALRAAGYGDEALLELSVVVAVATQHAHNEDPEG